MFMLTETGSFAQEIKKSRFIAFAGPVASEEEARAFIAERSDPAASHNCWAYRIGPKVRFQDDGEVSGTAGRPILQVIEGQELDRVVVLVTRWFGGTLLGSGGLVRAYGGTAALCLQGLQRGPIIETARLAVNAGFQDLALLKSRLLSVPGLSIETEMFNGEGARLALLMPAGELDRVKGQVRDLTRGRAVIDEEDEA